MQLNLQCTLLVISSQLTVLKTDVCKVLQRILAQIHVTYCLNIFFRICLRNYNSSYSVNQEQQTTVKLETRIQTGTKIHQNSISHFSCTVAIPVQGKRCMNGQDFKQHMIGMDETVNQCLKVNLFDKLKAEKDQNQVQTIATKGQDARKLFLQKSTQIKLPI